MSKNLWLFSVTSFLTDFSSEIIFPILPLLLTILGASTIDIGLVEGLSEFLSNTLRIPSGNLADTFKAKPLIIGGYLTSAISKSLYISSILLNTWFFVLLGRSLDRTGKAIRTPGRDALLSTTSKKDIGISFGIHRAFDTLGAITGSLFVLWFFYRFGSTETSIKHLIIIALIPAFLAIIPLLFVFEPKRNLVLKKEDVGISKPFTVFCIFLFVCSITSFSYAFYILMGKAQKLSFLEISLGYVIYNIVYAILSIPVGKFYDKSNNKLPLFSIVFLALSIAQALTSINYYLGFIVFGIYSALYDVIGRSMVSIFGVKKRSKAYGIYGFSSANAILFANLIIGVISYFIPLYLAFRIESALSIVLALVWWVYSNYKNSTHV